MNAFGSLCSRLVSNGGETQVHDADMVCSLSQKYDFLSAGVGAVVVTSFCVARGQSVTEALWITLASMVVALVAQDIFFKDEC